jgi:hypothetical protein
MMSAALDRFFDHYHRRRPVNATFTGIHTYDAFLPDWSPDGLDTLDGEMRALVAELSAAHPAPASARAYRDDVDLLDAELARAFLEIQLAENASGHGVRGNPSLWTGEAIFSVVSLMIRDFAPLGERLTTAAARLDAISGFLAQARVTVGDRAIPASWTAKAMRECEGGAILFTRGIERWVASASPSSGTAARVRAAATHANAALAHFAGWLRSRAQAPDGTEACGTDLFDLLLEHGHQCARSRSDLLAEARRRFTEERSRLDEMARATAGSWATAQEQLAADHPAPADYFDAFGRIWSACHESAASHDAVTWPDWPIRYVPYPEWTREAAPYLYYLHYRSPAPFDRYDIHDYVVPPLPAGGEDRHLRTWNHSVIKLNHVVHHGAIGHHVQNWHAYHRASSRVGKIAAVDCANRLGMFCAGTMAEGWACYVTGLMQELGFLTPLERLSEQHSRVRFLARAIVDIEIHQGTMSLEDAVRFYMERVGMGADASRGEAVKNSMFPAAAVIYWLGTQGILDLRETIKKRRGVAWSLKAFHDELLGHGSIPVPLIARLMTEDHA